MLRYLLSSRWINDYLSIYQFKLILNYKIVYKILFIEWLKKNPVIFDKNLLLLEMENLRKLRMI